MNRTLRPRTTVEAIAFRIDTGATLLAGGTDLMVRHRGYSGNLPTIDGPVLFLDAIDELHRIEVVDGAMTIGGAATLAEILGDGRTPALLRRSAALIAAPALRNRATLAGNICNASPAADSLPPLYVHDAEIIVRGANGERTTAIRDFITGPGATTLGPDEIVIAVRVPLMPDGRHYYRKVGTRRANALSKLAAAGASRSAGRVLTDVRFALGAVAPTVVRLRQVEDALEGVPVNELPGRVAALRALATPYIRPIDDQRSTAEYRTAVALNTLEEFLYSLMEDR